MPYRFKDQSLSNKILLYLLATGEVLSDIFMSPHEFRKRSLFGARHDSFKNTFYRLKRLGLIEYVGKGEKNCIKLSGKGTVQALIAKAKMPHKTAWDGKWRIIIFDIPESSKNTRDQLRALLKHNEFVKMQSSVYISPFSLNREAVSYLKETGLSSFIRIIRADEIDDDKDLKKKFKLAADKIG